MQATIEELETSNEELQATNEELVAANEELQSTNEELHSVNEELYTVNAEHQRKIQELSLLTDDMENLLASTRVHTVFLDREFKIRKFTPLATEIFGLLPHDIGRPFDSFAHRLRREKIDEDLRNVLSTDIPIESDVQDVSGNWFLLRILPYKRKHSVGGVLLTLIDISTLKQVQHDLARREFELRTITDHVPSLISYVDRDLKYRYVNQRFCDLFGEREESLIGRSMEELHGEQTFKHIKPMIDRVLSGEAVEFEHRFLLPNRAPFWALVNYIPDREDLSQPIRGFFVCKTVVTSLKEIEQRFDRAVRGTTDGIWDWNIDSGKVYYAPRFSELLGLDSGQTELAKADVDRRIHRDDLPNVIAAEMALIRDGVPMDVEFRLQCRDGSYRWFRGRASARYDESGHATHASGSIQDIEEYRGLVQEKQRQVEQRDRFIAMLSHELRNPLGAVTNGCGVLLRKSPPQQLIPVIEAITRQSRHMASLLNDLLDVARITEGKIDLHRQVIDLRDIVSAAIESVDHLFISRRQSIERITPESPTFVLGDPVRLQQVIGNLLSNASKYSPLESVIRITVSLKDSQVELRVIDQGEGIPKDLLRRIFEPFEQLGKRDGSSDGGLGIGLNVAESLVRLHGGQIEARSEGPGCGSEFVVQLPLTELATMMPENSQTALENVTPCRIVLVEDNHDARELLQTLLEDDGYQVQTAATGPEGLQCILTTRPDVAIIDVGLPGIDGHEVARAVRNEPVGQAIMLIALTGYGQSEDREAAIQAGFDAHLTKPVDLKQLEKMLATRPLFIGHP